MVAEREADDHNCISILCIFTVFIYFLVYSYILASTVIQVIHSTTLHTLHFVLWFADVINSQEIFVVIARKTFSVEIEFICNV